ncbi:DUF2283 domain-containing protein [Cellulomonas sp. URHB0016]
MSDAVRRTWDKRDDMAYFRWSDEPSEFQVHIQDPRLQGSIVLDFSSENRLIGVELINATLLLGKRGMHVLDGAVEP